MTEQASHNNSGIYFQDPLFPYSYSLHEALLNACENSSGGGGAYAFVSQDGIKLLMEDEAFLSFVGAGQYNLIIGLDAVTNESALTRLKKLQERVGDKLEIYAFLHDTKGSIFHPKFSWFKKNKGGIYVIGSGNLTARGLRRNREAFSVVEVSQAQIVEIEKYWLAWLGCNAKYLKSINDSEVIKRAKLNARIYLKHEAADKEEAELEAEVGDGAPEKIIKQPEAISEDTEAWDFINDDEVLIVEIPRSGSRWKQANFDKDSFTKFFGAQPGNNSHRILLRNVTKNGALSDIEVRPSVSVKSHNWRFELDAASGLDYPATGRPIGIFIRVSTRMFLYVLAMPTDRFYASVKQYLDTNTHGRADRMNKYITTVKDLRSHCTTLPIWNLS